MESLPIVVKGRTTVFSGTADPTEPEATPPTNEPDGLEAKLDLAVLLEDATPTLAAAYIELATAKANLPAAQEAVEEALVAHAEATRRHNQLSDSLALAERQLADAEESVAATADALDQSSKAVGAMAREAMISRGVYDPGLAVVLGNDTVDGAIGEHQAREAIGTARRTAIGQAQQDLGHGRSAVARLTAVTTEVTALQAEAEAALDEATAAKDQAELAKATLDALVEELTELTEKMEAEKLADQLRQQELEAEMRQLQAELAEHYANSDGPGPAWTAGYFGAPLATLNLTSPFGPRIHPVYGDVRTHMGVDYGAACGLPIYSIAAGVVVQSTSTQGYGYRVVVNHGAIGGAVLMSTYNHLESLGAPVGEAVALGSVIGKVGTTGVSTGCHLHFEIQRDGVLVDPLPYLTPGHLDKSV